MSSTLISLNVGGKLYTTTVATLQSGGSNTNYFDCLLSERFPLLKDNHGNIFIDRDGATFRYILNFLRGSALHVTEACPAAAALIYEEILEEAEFFGLTILAEELERRIEAIEEDENTPKIDNVVTELQRLQRQLKIKTPKKNTKLNGSTPDGAPSRQRSPAAQSPHRTGTATTYFPNTFDLNLSFWNIKHQIATSVHTPKHEYKQGTIMSYCMSVSWMAGMYENVYMTYIQKIVTMTSYCTHKTTHKTEDFLKT